MKLRSKDLVCTLHSKNAPHLPKMHPFQKCTRLSEKCTLLFWKCTLKNQKCTRAFSLGAFFYQNMSTKPTERQGYVPTQIIEKREILTVRVSLSHFYPTLIRQLPSHFCFKTLLWVLAQASSRRCALMLPEGRCPCYLRIAPRQGAPFENGSLASPPKLSVTVVTMVTVILRPQKYRHIRHHRHMFPASVSA